MVGVDLRWMGHFLSLSRWMIGGVAKVGVFFGGMVGECSSEVDGWSRAMCKCWPSGKRTWAISTRILY